MAMNPIVYLVIALLVLVRVPDCTEGAPPLNGDTSYTESEVAELKSENDMSLAGYGTSMLPAIQPGSSCHCVKTGDYEKGDIIAYFHKMDGESDFIAHRIVEKVNEKIFILKGDNNEFIDPYSVKEEDVVCEIPQIPIITKILNQIGGIK